MVCYPQLVRITAEDLEETSSLELGETWRLLLLCVSAQENDISLIGKQLVLLDILLKKDKIMSYSTPIFCSVGCWDVEFKGLCQILYNHFGGGGWGRGC